MASGYRTLINGVPVDLDDQFDPDVMGDGPTAPTYKVGATPLKYADIKYGTKGPNCGYADAGGDLSKKWAKKGSAVYKLPIDGQTFTGFNGLTAPATGSAFVSFGITGGDAWIIRGSLNAGSTTLSTGPVPTGATKVQYTWGAYTVPFGSDGGGSTSNGAATPTTLTSNPVAQYVTGVHGATATFQRDYAFRIDFFNAAGAKISTTNIHLAALTDSSA